MIKLIYAKDGIHLSDFDVFSYVQNFIERSKLAENSELVFSQGLILDQFRVFVRQGKIDHNNIIVHYNDGDFEYALRINEHGILQTWPNGFCDTYDKLLDQLIS